MHLLKAIVQAWTSPWKPTTSTIILLPSIIGCLICSWQLPRWQSIFFQMPNTSSQTAPHFQILVWLMLKRNEQCGSTEIIPASQNPLPGQYFFGCGLFAIHRHAVVHQSATSMSQWNVSRTLDLAITGTTSHSVVVESSHKLETFKLIVVRDIVSSFCLAVLRQFLGDCQPARQKKRELSSLPLAPSIAAHCSWSLSIIIETPKPFMSSLCLPQIWKTLWLQ